MASEELNNRIQINVSIADAFLTRAGFGILAVVHEHQLGLDRVLTYSSLAGSRADFPSYTPVGKWATFHFGQQSAIGGAVPEKLKVIERETGETMTQALDAAILVDADFYAVGTPAKLPADIQAGAAWALANSRFFGYSSAEADAITSADTDSFSVIQALSNNRALGLYTADAGGEFTIDTITVAGTTATADLTTFASVPMKVGDTVGIWTSVVPELNAEWAVDTIGALEFTFTVPSGTTSDVATSDAWFNYNLLEAALFGKMLPQDAGARTWDIQNLVGVTVDGAAGTTSAKLTGTAQTNLGGKNGNWFADMGGVNVTSGLKSNGFGGKMAGGRYADVQRGADWLQSNLQVDLATLLVNESGELGFDADDFQKVQTSIETRLNIGIDNKFLTLFTSGVNAGLPFVVTMPDLGTIPPEDKTARLLAGITAAANIRGKIQGMEADINLST